MEVRPVNQTSSYGSSIASMILLADAPARSPRFERCASVGCRTFLTFRAPAHARSGALARAKLDEHRRCIASCSAACSAVQRVLHCSARKPPGSLSTRTAVGATACRILAERPRDATKAVRHLPLESLGAGLAGASTTPIVESTACRPPRRFARFRAFHEQSPALGASTRAPPAAEPRSCASLPSPAPRSSPAAAAPPTPSPIQVPLRRARPRPAPGDRPKAGSASSPARP